MVKKIRCDVDGNDWVRADVSDAGNHVFVKMVVGGEHSNVLLTPADARKLRKQIKKALEAIEGVGEDEEEKPTTKDPRFPDWFQAGAIVEITGNTNSHEFEIGEKVRVVDGMRCEYLDAHDFWYVLPIDCKPA